MEKTYKEMIMEYSGDERSDVRRMLENNICIVQFTKKDGTTRIMKCTRMSEWIERMANDYGMNLPQGVRTPPPHQICVVDIDKRAWRSFRMDSVSEIMPMSDAVAKKFSDENTPVGDRDKYVKVFQDNPGELDTDRIVHAKQLDDTSWEITHSSGEKTKLSNQKFKARYVPSLFA